MKEIEFFLFFYLFFLFLRKLINILLINKLYKPKIISFVKMVIFHLVKLS